MLAMDPSSRETQDLVFLFKSVWVEKFLVGVGEAAGGADGVAGKGRNAADVSRRDAAREPASTRASVLE